MSARALILVASLKALTPKSAEHTDRALGELGALGVKAVEDCASNTFAGGGSTL